MQFQTRGGYFNAPADHNVEGKHDAVLGSIRRALLDGASVGLALAAFSGTPQRTVWLAPRAGTAQLSVLADALARMSPIASSPFETLLASLPQRLRPGSTILTVSGRYPATDLPTLRRLARIGFAVRHLALGPGAAEAAGAVREVGITADTASLTPDWERADALTIAR